MSSNFINIGLGVETGPLKSGMDEAVNKITSAGKKMEEAAVNATTKTEKSFSNLRQAYRATAKDAYEVALQQGTQSAAFMEATERAGKFKDELDLVNAKIQAFSSDTPVLTSALGLGQGLAGGFAAAQGAMALFGDQSKEVEQALVKVQGAMALLQGLQAIGQLTDAMAVFGTVIKTNVIPALMTMQGAIMATGIGAIVVAVVALTQAASAYNDQIDREIDLKKELADQDKKYQEAVSKSVNANLKTEELKIRAMQDGTAKQKAELDLRAKQEIQAEKDIFEASNKTFFDTQRLQERTNLIKDFYKNEVSKIQADVSKSAASGGPKFTGFADPMQTIGGKQGILKGNLLGDLPEQLKTAKVAIDNFVTPAQAQLSNFEAKLTESFTQIGELISQVAVNAFGQLGTALGQSLAGVDVSLEKILGGIADTLGNGLIAIGAPMLAVPGTVGLGAAYMGAGFALKAVAGYLNSQGSGKSVPSNKGGSYSPSNSNSGFTPSNTDSMSLSTRLVGTDLLLSVEKSNKRMERVR